MNRGQAFLRGFWRGFGMITHAQSITNIELQRRSMSARDNMMRGRPQLFEILRAYSHNKSSVVCPRTTDMQGNIEIFIIVCNGMLQVLSTFMYRNIRGTTIRRITLRQLDNSPTGQLVYRTICRHDYQPTQNLANDNWLTRMFKKNKVGQLSHHESTGIELTMPIASYPMST